MSPDSSKDSARGAGWGGLPWADGWRRMAGARGHNRWTEFSWLTVRSLLDSANDTIAKNVHDLVNARRMRWVAAQRAAGADPDMRVTICDPDQESLRFLYVGDPGEADASQYVVVEPLQAKAKEKPYDFLLLGSDVIYPAGDVNDYENAYFLPYGWVDRPILGQPGNHDWYDGLAGFMWHFCGAEPLPPAEYRASSFTVAERLARGLWRAASRPSRARLLALRALSAYRTGERWEPSQPGPYFSVEVRDLKIIVIDPGITGRLDHEQGQWLVRESKGPKKKLLITGKPIYVNNCYEPGDIVWDTADFQRPRPDWLELPAYETVDDVVRDVHHNYVAVIGGDTHSYQRYEVTIRPWCERDGEHPDRVIQYIVAGGGGAFLSTTHGIPPVLLEPGLTPRLPAEVQPVGEEDFVCYPNRGDSIAYGMKPLRRFLSWWSRVMVLLAAAGVLWLAMLGETQAGRAGFSPSAWDAFKGLVILAATGGIILLVVWATRRFAPTGYRTFCAVSSGLGAIAGEVWVLTHFKWDEESSMAAAILAVIAIPLVLVLVGYYTRGLGPRFLVDTLTAGALAAGALTLLGMPGWDPLLTVAGAAVLLACSVPVLGTLRRRHGARYRKSLVALGLAMVVWILFREDAWHTWPVQAGLTAMATVSVLLAVAFFLGFFRAIRSIRHLRDPDALADEILLATHARLGIAPHPRVNGRVKASNAAREVVDVFLGRRQLLRKLVDPIVDHNEPPFFKHFLTVDVSAHQLLIRCWGATGLQEHAKDPPLEDSVPAIDLTPAARTAPARS